MVRVNLRLQHFASCTAQQILFFRFFKMAVRPLPKFTVQLPSPTQTCISARVCQEAVRSACFPGFCLPADEPIVSVRSAGHPRIYPGLRLDTRPNSEWHYLALPRSSMEGLCSHVGDIFLLATCCAGPKFNPIRLTLNPHGYHQEENTKSSETASCPTTTPTQQSTPTPPPAARPPQSPNTHLAPAACTEQNRPNTVCSLHCLSR